MAPDGLFITFDGPNGCGKTTVLQGVASRLAGQGLDIFETKEPTNSELGQFVRAAEESTSGKAFACLVAADRYKHISCEVLPALAQGMIVISDRYVASSLVLQRLDGVETEFIWAINGSVLVPDLSIILLAEPAVLERRLSGRPKYSRFERTKSRADELAFYREAALFLTEQKFNGLVLDNPDGSLGETVDAIFNNIMMLHAARRVVV